MPPAHALATPSSGSFWGTVKKAFRLKATARSVFDQVAGFGPLQRFFDDPSVEEIWINEPGRVFIARHGRSELTTVILTSD